jgi:hypothetical protein
MVAQKNDVRIFSTCRIKGFVSFGADAKNDPNAIKKETPTVEAEHL